MRTLIIIGAVLLVLPESAAAQSVDEQVAQAVLAAHEPHRTAAVPLRGAVAEPVTADAG